MPKNEMKPYAEKRYYDIMQAYVCDASISLIMHIIRKTSQKRRNEVRYEKNRFERKLELLPG